MCNDYPVIGTNGNKNMKLKKVKLENFKCYQNATIVFKNLTIIVGENNAGKSCLIEALRIISKATQCAKKRTYKFAPTQFDLPIGTKGFNIDTDKLKIDLRTVIYFYNRANYAKITAFFHDKTRIEIYLDETCVFAVLFDSNGNAITNKQKAEELSIDSIGILPQIGPIREFEKFLSDDTIRGDKDTYLSSLHFRNEIYLWMNEYFDLFKTTAEQTWKGLVVAGVEGKKYVDEHVSLFVQDNGFPAEIGKMGNGLQMWLQIIWFLTRSRECDVIILDEPDVYMHSDMQRKILEYVTAKFPQVIIATHSLEIISRVSPNSILEIRKKDKQITYATDLASVQTIIDDIGGVSNLSLLNLGRQRRCLFVEGNDFNLLNKFNEVVYGKSLDIANFHFGGFNNIRNVYGASEMLFKETHNQIKCFAIADRDYRDEKIVDVICRDAENHHLQLHIWDRKEIENYLIDPVVIYSFVPNKEHYTYDDFLKEFDELLESYKDPVFDNYSEQYASDSKCLSEDGKRWGNIKSNELARAYVDNNWTSRDKKIALVSGKDFLSEIKRFFQDKYKVTISNDRIIKKFSIENVPEEIRIELEKLN